MAWNPGPSSQQIGSCGSSIHAASVTGAIISAKDISFAGVAPVLLVFHQAQRVSLIFCCEPMSSDNIAGSRPHRAAENQRNYVLVWACLGASKQGAISALIYYWYFGHVWWRETFHERHTTARNSMRVSYCFYSCAIGESYPNARRTKSIFLLFDCWALCWRTGVAHYFRRQR